VLTTAVPPVAGWHDTSFPKAITANDVQRLLDSCDISDPAGVRDYAILMLVARLGLRSIEVARLQLDDVDWRAGRIVLRGKASREDGMPLPADCRGGGHDGHLRQGRLRRPAGSRPALAGSATMSALSDAARDYLRLRNSLGHELAEHSRDLPGFVAVLDAAGLPTVTVAAALQNVRTRRSIMSCIRGEFFSSPAAIQSTPRRGNLPDLAGADHRDGPPSPISQNASSGRNFPQDRRRP
jgi:hypothetical protein